MAETNNGLLLTFLVVFFALGWAMPYIFAEYGTSSTIDTTASLNQLNSAEVGALDVITSISTIFFWSFGAIPLWLNLMLLIPRLIFWVIVYDKIRGI